MKRLVVIIALALPLVILTSTFALAQEPIEGEWAGGFRIARKWGFIKIQFRASEKGLSGIADRLDTETGEHVQVISKSFINKETRHERLEA